VGWSVADSAYVTSGVNTIDTAEKRTGAGCQKLSLTTSDEATRIYCHDIALPGNTGHNANGHDNAHYYLEVYAKRDASDKGQRVKISFEELDSTLSVLATHTADAWTVLTAAYAKASHDAAITQNTARWLRVKVICGVAAAQSAAVFYIDDFKITEKYTCEVNPSGPKGVTADPSIPEATDTDNNNAFFLQRLPAANEKYRNGKLVFNQCPPAQVNALRSLWRWGKAVIMTLNNPDYPATLTVYLGLPASSPIGSFWSVYQLTVPWNEI
jgi:hypothetical protein